MQKKKVTNRNDNETERSKKEVEKNQKR